MRVYVDSVRTRATTATLDGRRLYECCEVELSSLDGRCRIEMEWHGPAPEVGAGYEVGLSQSSVVVEDRP